MEEIAANIIACITLLLMCASPIAIVWLFVRWRRNCTSPKVAHQHARQKEELPTPLSFYTKIAGVSHGKRQTYIGAHVSAGDALDLVREDDNPHDPDVAVAVHHDGTHLGYLNSPRAKEVRRHWLDRRTVVATVKQVTGGKDKERGVNVLVRVD